MANIARNMGLGVVLSMQNRLSGPASAGAASMGVLTAQTNKAAVSQTRLESTLLASKIALAGAAGITVALGFAIVKAAKFEEGMARVGAVLEPTTRQFNMLTDAAIQAGIKTQFSPRQATEGLKELATAGFNATEANLALLPVLDLATGSLGQLGVAGAATAATAAIRGFGLEATDASKVVDVLLRSTQLTNLQARDFEVSIGLVAGQAKAAGQEFEHTIALLGALRNTGQSASVSATSLQNALRGIVQPKAQRELKQLGVTIRDQNGDFRSLADIMFDVKKATADFGEVQRFMILQTIFGTRGLRAYNAVATLGATKFNRLEGSLLSAGGTAEKFRKAVLEPLIGRLVLMGGSISTLATQIGSPLLSPIKVVISILTKFLNVLITLTQWFPNLTKAIVLTAALAAITLGIVGIMLLFEAALIGLASSYVFINAVKWAYFVISGLIFGVEGMTRKQFLLSIIVTKFKNTIDLASIAITKIKLFLGRLLGISIGKNIVITNLAAAAIWKERIARLGSNVALGINNALRWIGNKLAFISAIAMGVSTKATVANTTATHAAAGATGALRGALAGLKVALLTNPILLVATALIVTVVVVRKLVKAFWEAEGAAKALFGFLIWVVNPLLLPIVLLAKTLHSAWVGNIGGIRTAFGDLKKAILSIFAPIGKLFKALEGSNNLGGVFKSIMRLVLRPFVGLIKEAANAATFLGSIIELIVKNVSQMLLPMQPAIDELSGSFDELAIAIFGKDASRLIFWKKFAGVIQFVVRVALVPLAKVISFIVKGITLLARVISAISSPIGSLVSNISAIGRGAGRLLSGAASVGLGFTTGMPFGFADGGIVQKGKPVNGTFEGRSDEVVLALPPGMRPNDLQKIFNEVKQSRSSTAGGAIKVVIENIINLDGQEMARFQTEQDVINNLRDFEVG